MGNEGRRLKLVKISNDLLTDLLRLGGQSAIKIDGLPKDARLVRVGAELFFDQDVTGIIFESEDFQKLGPADTIPVLNLQVTEIYRDVIERDAICDWLESQDGKSPRQLARDIRMGEHKKLNGHKRGREFI